MAGKEDRGLCHGFLLGPPPQVRFEAGKERIPVQPTDALLVIDAAQDTFKPGGDLPVAGGDEIDPIILDGVMPRFMRKQRDATLDVHPAGHCSRVDSYLDVDTFEELQYMYVAAMESTGWVGRNAPQLAPHALFDLEQLEEYLVKVGGKQVVWSKHGDPFSPKTWFCRRYRRDLFNFVLIKGTDPCDDSYSAVKSNGGRPTGLVTVYRRRGVKRVFLVGLAFDFCVGWTAEDLVNEGFEVVIIEDATRSVFPDTAGKTMREKLFAKGVKFITSDQLVAA